MTRKPAPTSGPTTPPDAMGRRKPQAAGKASRVVSASMLATLLDVARGTVIAWVDRDG